MGLLFMDKIFMLSFYLNSVSGNSIIQIVAFPYVSCPRTGTITEI